MTTTISQRKNRAAGANPLQKFWRKRRGDILPPIFGILGFLLLWQLISSAGLIKLPPPQQFVDRSPYPHPVDVSLLRPGRFG